MTAKKFLSVRRGFDTLPTSTVLPSFKPRRDLLLRLPILDLPANAPIEPIGHARPRKRRVVIQGRQRADTHVAAARLVTTTLARRAVSVRPDRANRESLRLSLAEFARA